VDKCRGVKRDGTPCSLPAASGRDYYWAHEPQNAEARRASASKAGSKSSRSKASAELLALKRRITEVAEGVLAGSVSRGDGAVFGQLMGVAVRCVEAEVKVRELEEIRLPEFQELRDEVRELRRYVEKEKTSGGYGAWQGG
jgi:hypothetical protein